MISVWDVETWHRGGQYHSPDICWTMDATYQVDIWINGPITYYTRYRLMIKQSLLHPHGFITPLQYGSLPACLFFFRIVTFRTQRAQIGTSNSSIRQYTAKRSAFILSQHHCSPDIYNGRLVKDTARTEGNDADLILCCLLRASCHESDVFSMHQPNQGNRQSSPSIPATSRDKLFRAVPVPMDHWKYSTGHPHCHCAMP